MFPQMNRMNLAASALCCDCFVIPRCPLPVPVAPFPSLKEGNGAIAKSTPASLKRGTFHSPPTKIATLPLAKRLGDSSGATFFGLTFHLLKRSPYHWAAFRLAGELK